jgi:hypothetical protein
VVCRRDPRRPPAGSALRHSPASSPRPPGTGRRWPARDRFRPRDPHGREPRRRPAS